MEGLNVGSGAMSQAAQDAAAVLGKKAGAAGNKGVGKVRMLAGVGAERHECKIRESLGYRRLRVLINQQAIAEFEL